MAGGKETPRQKMIGMMYLVLTALLALQVSNAVLEKFAIIYETLEELARATDNKNALTLDALKKEKGKSAEPKVVAALAASDKVRELTKNTVAEIQKLKGKMMTLSGTQEIDEKLINDHSSKVAAMMMTQPEGKEFEKLLNDYVKQLRQLSGLTEKELPNLARAPKEIDAFKGDEDHASKDFLTFTFENTPVIAALASVTQMQTEVLEHESKALTKLAADAGQEDVKFDKVVAMVRAKEQIVAAGASYEADLFISASSTAFQPEMYQNGQKLNIVDEDGIKMGKIKFTASGGNYDKNGFAKKSFNAEIKLPEKTLPLTVEYTVVKPIIKVTTGNAPRLYMNCGNNVTIDVPVLGAAYNPSFSSAGAEIKAGDAKGKVIIIPKAKKITVDVRNSGTPIGSEPFDVKDVPSPRFAAYVGTTPVDLKKGIKASDLKQLRVLILPDPNFKEEVPRDARYSIRDMEVSMGSGVTATNTTKANNGSPDLSSWTGQAKPGGKILFEVKDAIRKTYTDADEKVNLKETNYQIMIPIN